MSRRMKRIGDALVPSATTTRVFFCPDRHIHLLGLDDAGNPMCEVVLGRALMMVLFDALTENSLSDDEDEEHPNA